MARLDFIKSEMELLQEILKEFNQERRTLPGMEAGLEEAYC